MLQRIIKILAVLSLIVMLLAAGLGAASHFFPSSSTKMGSTSQQQTVFANGQFLIRQTQTIVHPESIEHSSHTVFKIGFWSIIPWTLIFPILWVRYAILKRGKPKEDSETRNTKAKSG